MRRPFKFTVVSLMASALLVPVGTGAAAQAAPHVTTINRVATATVPKAWRQFEPPQTFVDGKFATVTVKAQNTRVITLTNGEHAYSSYRLTVHMNTAPRTVLYSEVLSPWRAAYAFTALTSTGEMKRGYTGTKQTRAALRQRLAYVEDESVKTLRDAVIGYRHELAIEHRIMKTSAPLLLQRFLSAWHWAGRKHTFDGIDFPRTGMINGYAYAIVGNDPTTAQLRLYAVKGSKTWVGIQNNGVAPEKYVLSGPAAAKTAAIHGTFNMWLVNNDMF